MSTCHASISGWHDQISDVFEEFNNIIASDRYIGLTDRPDWFGQSKSCSNVDKRCNKIITMAYTYKLRY